MIAMGPLFEAIFHLEGFEKVAFWLLLFIGLLGSGFFVDFLMSKQGFGVFWNALYVFAGGFLGLYLRYNYFLKQPWYSYEPVVTIVLFFGSITILLISMSYLRNRLG